jgi:hypothetical protein
VAFSVCRRSVIGTDSRIGPFAVLEEGTEVPAGGVVGGNTPQVGADPPAVGSVGNAGDRGE